MQKGDTAMCYTVRRRVRRTILRVNHRVNEIELSYNPIECDGE